MVPGYLVKRLGKNERIQVNGSGDVDNSEFAAGQVKVTITDREIAKYWLLLHWMLLSGEAETCIIRGLLM